MIPVTSLQDAFPEVSPGIRPFGTRVLVQLRLVKQQTKSGIILVEDTRQFNKANTQLAKVIDMGPLAFCNRDTGNPWNEGMWAKVGDLVRIPQYGGDRFERELEPGSDEKVIFALFQDHELLGEVQLEAFENLDQIL